MNGSQTDLMKDVGEGDSGKARESERVFVQFAGSGAAKPMRGSILSEPMFVAGFVVLLAAGSLLGMRYYGPKSASATELPKYTPSEFAKSDAERARELVEELERSTRPLQFGADTVLASPFIEPLTEEVVAVQVDDAARMAERRMLELTARFERIELHSVLGGRIPVARINEGMFREGDTVDGLFAVEKITGRGVLLTAEGRRFVLVPKSSG